MKRLLMGPARGSALALMLGLTLASLAAWADPAGQQLAQRVYDRNNGKDATSLVTMTLTESGRAPRVRRMVNYRLESKKGETKTLLRFTEPDDIAGTGLLTHDHHVGDSDQWVYLPALDRVRRISASRKGGRFVNSEYYYEDLRQRKPDQDQHRLLGKESLQGVNCEVLESVPANADNSVYLKRISWIDPTTLLPLRVDFYEKNDSQPSKRLLASKTRRVQGVWLVMDSTIIDLSNNNQTRLTVDKIVLDRNLPHDLFTTQALEDESVEEEYRL